MSKPIAASHIRLKRAYDPPTADDGYRILIDRLWPRGVRKADAAIDQWAKDLAPSTELRLWFGHDPASWEEFRRRYAQELALQKEAIQALREQARNDPITLVYAAKDERCNNAVALRDFLLGRLAGAARVSLLHKAG